LTVANGSARTPTSDQDASRAPVLGQDILLKKGAKKAVAPCVQSAVVNGTTVGTTVILPVNESITLTGGPQKETRSFAQEGRCPRVQPDHHRDQSHPGERRLHRR